MAEIQLTRIKSIYGDIRGLLSQIPSIETQKFVKDFIVETYNRVLDELSVISGTNYLDYKIPESQRSRTFPDRFESTIVRTQIGRVISRLEEEYGFNSYKTKEDSPGIVIFNKNQSEISLQINYSITDLINKINDENGKDKLRELESELEKKDKNWEKIKGILIWILNFSKDLFLEILPIILQKKI
ncbi:MAG: hypothetical protein AB1333_04400 [Patescibacteria group bacterium]